MLGGLSVEYRLLQHQVCYCQRQARVLEYFPSRTLRVPADPEVTI